jgi:hypothetical protein
VDSDSRPSIVGSEEWLALPDFALACLRAKVDLTSATSWLHAEDILPAGEGVEGAIRFRVFPIPSDRRTAITAEASLAGDSRQHGRATPVVETVGVLGRRCFLLRLLLVPAAMDGFAVVLGRDALEPFFSVDRRRRFVAGPPILGPFPELDRAATAS